jgi:DNA primase
MTAIARVQDPVLQDQLVLRAAETLRIPDARLRPLLRESLRAEPRRTSPRAERAPARAPEPAPPIDDRWGPPPDDEWAPSPGQEAVYADDAPDLPAPAARPVVLPEESELLRLMLRQGLPMVEYVLTRLSVAEFSAGPVRDVVEVLVAQYQAGAVDREPFVRGAHGEAVRALVTETLAVRHSLSNENWQRRIGMVVPDRDDKPFDVAQSAIKLLRLRRIQEAIGQAMMQVDAAERDGKDTTPFQQRIVELNTVRQAIEAGEAVGGAG